MPSFFKSLFGANARSSSEKSGGVKSGEKSEDVPAMTRKMSLTKSGRLKEKKRHNVSVSDYFPDEKKQNSEKANVCDETDDDEVFTLEDVLKEMRQIARMEVKSN